MKYTLLELTQNILSSMDSDEINSISDSPEALQVVAVIKTVYDDIISRGDLTSSKTLFNLTPSGTSTKPTLMYKPEDIDRIEWLRYNCKGSVGLDPDWKDLTYLPIDDYMRYIHNLNPSERDVDSFQHTMNGYLFTFNYKNDNSPNYYSSFEDNVIVFDAYDSSVDSTLQSSKTLGYGQRKTVFEENDTFVPNLQPQQFALLLNEAKSLAWAELKQTVHAKAENTARRNWRHLQKTRNNLPISSAGNYAHPFDQLRNFGRRR